METKTTTHLLVAAACGLQLTACATVYSPPARFLPLESVATLARGETGVQVEGASHQTLGETVAGGTLRVRHGVREDVDVSIEGFVAHIDGPYLAQPNIWSARLGVKHRLNRFVALTAGVGGGAWTGGGFFSPDVGTIFAWENKYLVPFFSARGAVSQPIGTATVNTLGYDYGLSQRDPMSYLVRRTWSGAFAAGLRLPLGNPDSKGIHGSLLAGAGLTFLTDVVQEGFDMWLNLGGGAEITF